MTFVRSRITAGLLAGALIVSPAQAQFGGVLGKVKSAAGLGGSSETSPMSGDEADVFLDNSIRSTKNVMIAAMILAYALDQRGELTGLKAKIGALNSITATKEFGAQKTDLVSNLAAIGERKDIGAAFQTRYNAGTAEEKKILGIAAVNLAIGIARNIDLVGRAPGVLAAAKRNPMMLTRIGQFKTAIELVALQGKGLSGIAVHVPKMMAAAKVRAPKDAKTTEPTSVSL